MGQKAAIVLVGCNGVSLLIWLCCMFSNNWLDKTFYVPGGSIFGVHALSLNAGLIGMTMDPPFFCPSDPTKPNYITKKGKWAEDFCNKLSRERDYHQMQDAFCEDQVRAILFPTACFSIKLFMWAGRIMFIFLVFTIVIQITASAFVGYYFTKSAKGRYRQIATILLLTAPIMDFMALCFYTYAATMFCDMFRDCRIPMLFPQEGSSFGNVHWSWIWAFINCMCMFIFPFVVHNLKTKSERLQKEARMQAEFEAEMSRYGVDQYGGQQGAYGYQDPYSQQYDPYSQQQQGADPYAQQQSGYGQPAYAGAYGY